MAQMSRSKSGLISRAVCLIGNLPQRPREYNIALAEVFKVPANDDMFLLDRDRVALFRVVDCHLAHARIDFLCAIIVVNDFQHDWARFERGFTW